GLADGLGKAETAVDLHGPGGNLIALDAGQLAGLANLGDGHVDAARGKVHGKCKPDRSAADDQHACVKEASHGRNQSYSTRMFAASITLFQRWISTAT